jgi:L-threonylcarbamoyladenylate synthase
MNFEELKNVIDAGGVAVIPTDTVYGIIADATNEEAIKKIYKIKRRDYSKPLIIMVSSIEMLLRYVDNVSLMEKEIINKYWPGKLTILFKKNNKLSSFINNGGEYVGIRLPDNEDIIKLINMLEKPLVSTSANISEKDTIVSVDLLEEELANNIDYIYDGGVLSDVPSTIIKVDNNSINFLRKGDIAEQIERDFIE